MKQKKIKNKSSRKILRDEIGKLHLAYLIKKRGNRCQLSGRPANGLGRFHILPVGSNPRLEFADENVLLANWLPYHYLWHHDFVKAQRTVEPLIVKLKGKNYREDLLKIEVIKPRHSEFYLQNLKFWFTHERSK